MDGAFIKRLEEESEGSLEQSTPKCWKTTVSRAPYGKEVGHVVLLVTNICFMIKFGDWQQTCVL